MPLNVPVTVPVVASIIALRSVTFCAVAPATASNCTLIAPGNDTSPDANTAARSLSDPVIVVAFGAVMVPIV